MKVKCIICGYETVVRPGTVPYSGNRLRGIYKNYPSIWICDTHDLNNIEYIEV